MPDGILPPDDKKKQMVVPAALKVVHLKSTWKLAYLGQLDHEDGWKSHAVTAPLQERRRRPRTITERKSSCEAVETGRKECGEEN